MALERVVELNIMVDGWKIVCTKKKKQEDMRQSFAHFWSFFALCVHSDGFELLDFAHFLVLFLLFYPKEEQKTI